MQLPYNLQRLPAEALTVLRYLGTNGPASAPALESGTGLSARLVGKAIRRLVNFDQIEFVGGAYDLTTDGSISVRQLAEYDAARAAQGTPGGQSAPTITAHRRLAVVMPRIFAGGQPGEIFLGVNQPTEDTPALRDNIPLVLRLTAVGGSLSMDNLTLTVPPDRAAEPGKLRLVPAQAGGTVRVRLDAFQGLDSDLIELAALGGFYFDVPVASQPHAADATMRAVGMDLYFKPLK
jgi:hypothetical protein